MDASKTKFLCKANLFPCKTIKCKYQNGEFCIAYNGKVCPYRVKDHWETCYHATKTKAIADKILKEGFKPWTYFAKNLQGSIWMGEWVFAVMFHVKEMEDFWQEPWAWQFMCRNWIPPDRIMALHHIKRETLYFDRKLRWFRFKSAVEHITRRKGI